MTGIMVTGSDCVAKAGSGVSAAFDPFWTGAQLMAESLINTVCKHDFSADYAAGTLGSSAKFLLNDVASSIVAVQAITFDMTGYPSRIVAEDAINVNRDTALRGLSILRDKSTQDWINGT